jgi:RND family efflux transporter MFP subunit
MEHIPPVRKNDSDQGHASGRPEDNRKTDPEYIFWRQFVEATTPRAFCQSWLPLQCRMLNGVRCAMVLLGDPGRGPYTPVAVWPDAKMSMNHLTTAAERALKERRGLVIKKDPSPDAENNFPENFHVAYPIEVSGDLHGVVVLGVDQEDKRDVQAIMRHLHWGAAWLEVLIRRTGAQESSEVTDRLNLAFHLIASAVELESFYASATALVTHMDAKLECDRVSIGFKPGKHVKIKALSYSAGYGKQTNLVRAIGSAMDEAVDQQSVVVYPLPPDAEPVVTRAHEELAKQHGSGTILTIPLGNKGTFFGGLTLERPAEKVFDRQTIELCESVASVVGPILETKRVEERWLIIKALASFKRQLKRFFGPRHLIRKLVVILLVALVVFFSVFKIDYRVAATATVEGVVQRVIAAPFNGYVKDAPVRPGDIVTAGELLCLLDDRDLSLERIKWATQKNQLVKEFNAAMAKYDRAQIQILRAKIDQADAQLALIRDQLSRTKVVAPFNGVVMSGDLHQSLGTPVERGQELFQIAPLDAYRVIFEVDERDITEIAAGQKSELMLPSIPGETFAFVVDKITPVSTAREGRNYFRIEGRMEQGSKRLRPGMEGIGKITIDRRKLIWVWTHQMIDWLRLKIWRWWP